tara:strand:+ start:68832 stop:69404 length:573 start_codon:yes stop_codon:yes gene_type:complete
MYKLALLLLTNAALASSGFLTFGYGDGGDSLSSASGGQNYRTHAGSGLFFMLGKIITVSPTVPHHFEAQLGIGYLFQNDAREQDSSVSWSRVPIEAIYFYKNTIENFRLGWGSTCHINSSINAKGTNASASTSVENAWGFVLAAEKLWVTETNEMMSIGLRHTSMNYRLTAFDKVVNGDNLSVTFTGFLF